MCIITKEIKVAAKDIIVYKVATYNYEEGQIYTLFRSLGGGEEPEPINESLHKNDILFDREFGFSSFQFIEDCKIYIEELLEYGKIHKLCDSLVIIKLKIPKGIRYAKGYISPKYRGAGLSARRSERLEYIRGEVLIQETFNF